ncbi:M24 family metallopeptidase [Synergistes jonesii]|uniref:M24 family metallopeptidase n=1 Tax=Synergistes jonesii TaxID=2754 RepID=UPI00242C4D07|nr:aminopeptidase P family protein [Synergistes jonesii]
MIKKERLARLAGELKNRGLDALYIGPSADLEYIGEFRSFPDERVRGLMVGSDGRCFALTPLLYREEMTDAFGDLPFYSMWDDHEGFAGAFKRGCEHLGVSGGKVAFNDGVRAVDLFAMLEAVDIRPADGQDLLANMRSRKDGEELDRLRRAGAIIDGVVEKLYTFIKPGMKERDVIRAIPDFIEELGGEGESFAPIVASGPNGSMPHYGGDRRVIAEHDSVILDLGCRYKSYCSDTTRTFFVGEPTREMREVYEIVRRAQAAGEAAVKPGVTAEEVDRAARRVIVDAGYGKYFFNRVGHGVGIAVHETPFIIEGNKKPLEPGNVFSVEPGIYIPGKFGVRIENLVAVKPDGTAEALNKTTREMRIIK